MRVLMFSGPRDSRGFEVVQAPCGNDCSNMHTASDDVSILGGSIQLED